MGDEIRLMLAGATAGAVTKTLTAPLERAKILLQVQRGANPLYRGAWGTLRRVVAEEGTLALWKGNGTNVLRIIPNYGLKFTLNDVIRDWVRGDGAVNRMTFGQLLVSGSLAGLGQMLVTYPLETIRTRLTMSRALGSHYSGLVHCCRDMLATEGVTSFYKGLVPALLSGIPYVGLQMSLYQEMQNALAAQDGQVSVARKLVAGASAGVIAQTFTFPGDTLRRRMQTDGMGGARKEYASTWHGASTIMRTEGIAGFYRGAGVNVMRAVPGAAIQFAVFDFVKAALI